MGGRLAGAAVWDSPDHANLPGRISVMTRLGRPEIGRLASVRVA